jgi:hypothetical protein
MATSSELLAQVETAISNCLTAQSYSVAGRQKTMAQLRELREFRKELVDEIASGSESNGSMCSLMQMGVAE